MDKSAIAMGKPGVEVPLLLELAAILNDLASTAVKVRHGVSV